MIPDLRYEASELGSAVFSICGTYRYLLTRSLCPEDEDTGSCLFIMLNPSVADAFTSDPTIRRCIAFATGWGVREMRVINLFAYRTAHPGDLISVLDPVGPRNNEIIRSELRKADLVVAAWGNHGTLHRRADAVRAMLTSAHVQVNLLGENRNGEPRHPLYLPIDTPLASARFAAT